MKDTALTVKNSYFFGGGTADGSAEMADLLGGKGAGLAEMSRLGIPVPPGFTIPAPICSRHLRGSQLSDELWQEVMEGLRRIEAMTGKVFGDPRKPLILAVRSGAKIFMPGMMETVHYVGLNQQTASGLPNGTGADCLKRLWDKEGACFPEEPLEQLRAAIVRVIESWDSKATRKYRQLHHIPDDLGTACTVQSMVFGNLDLSSGSGVAFTRNPLTGYSAMTGEFLLASPGEALVSGSRTPIPIHNMLGPMPEAYQELQHIGKRLEAHYRELLEIEFTVESGKLWVLQVMPAKCSALAHVKTAVDLAKSGHITKEQAILRISAEELGKLHLKQIADPTAKEAAKGIAASPGTVLGRVVFCSEDVAQFSDPILLRMNPNRDDIQVIEQLAGLVTIKGGAGSHFSVIARNRGIPAVVGCEEQIQIHDGWAEVGTLRVAKGDLLTLDGSRGRVFVGKLALSEQELDPSVQTLLAWCDEKRTLSIRVFADTIKHVSEAAGHGVPISISTERMFMNGDASLISRVILADTAEEKTEACKAVLEKQRTDLEELFRISKGISVMVRLLDPPLSEFLPPVESASDAVQKRKLARFHQNNPLLGHRGCRLLATHPELYRIQIQAIFEAMKRLSSDGQPIEPTILIPFVSSAAELVAVKTLAEAVFHRVFENASHPLPTYKLASMLETPRAALLSDEISRHADLLLFGLMDLSQLVFGASRDDTSAFLATYLERGIWPADPFLKLDQDGVGKLMQLSCQQARRESPRIAIEVTAWESASVHFVQKLLAGSGGLLCPLAVLEPLKLLAAQAALAAREG